MAEPWHLRGKQEQRLQEFLDQVPVKSAPNLKPLTRCQFGYLVLQDGLLLSQLAGDAVA